MVPFVESRSATATRPSRITVTAQCSRETSGSSSGTSASAERPTRICPLCSRCTPPASGPATTCSWGAPRLSSGRTSGTGPCSATTAPSTSGGSPSTRRCRSSRSAAGVEHDRAPGVRPADGRREPRGDRGQHGACGCGDEHVTAHRGGRGLVAAARPEDGQPDLHRRQRSLLRGARCVRPAGEFRDMAARSPPTRHGRVVRSGLPEGGAPVPCRSVRVHPRTCRPQHARRPPTIDLDRSRRGADLTLIGQRAGENRLRHTPQTSPFVHMCGNQPSAPGVFHGDTP